MKVPYLNLPAEFDRAPVWEAIKGQLESGWFVGGPTVERFEARFAELMSRGVRFEKELAHNERYRITHAFFRDPDGYLLEVQRFDDPAWSVDG